MTGAGGNFTRYLAKAFLFRWNLLAVWAAAAFGVLSGRPDVVLPLVGAAELCYLAGLATRPRFQAAVDAEDAARRRASQSTESHARAKAMLKTLNPEDLRRFELLRDLCIRLFSLSRGISPESIDDDLVRAFNDSSINRLLWVFVKLLFSKQALEQYFSTVQVKKLEEEKVRVEAKLASLGAAPPDESLDAPKARLRASLADHLVDLQMRFENYRKAKEHYELLIADVERLQTKISGLAETGIQRPDADFINNEIDRFSESFMRTERAMNDLRFIDGLANEEEAAPPMVTVGGAKRP